jgi:hypothetical protein
LGPIKPKGINRIAKIDQENPFLGELTTQVLIEMHYLETVSFNNKYI